MVDIERLLTYDEYDESFENGHLMDQEDYAGRNSVLTRLSRILHWSLGDETIDDLVGENIVRTFLERYEEFKVRERQIQYTRDQTASSTRSLHQLIVYSLAKLCYWNWVRNSSLVVSVLKHVFEADGHFSGIFLSTVDSAATQFSIWRIRTHTSREKEYSVLVYFIHHARMGRFEENGIRFLDLNLTYPTPAPPVVLAAVHMKPSALLMFLRHGVQLRHHHRQNSVYDWDIADLFRHLLRMLWICFGRAMMNQNGLALIATNAMQRASLCLSLLLRAIPLIEWKTLDFPLTIFDRGLLIQTVESREFIWWLTDQGIVPYFAERYCEPPRLRHFCRCAIRKALNETWSLPEGVCALNMPFLLERYLDLIED